MVSGLIQKSSGDPAALLATKTNSHMLKCCFNVASWYIIMFSTLGAVMHLFPAGEKVVKLHSSPHSYSVT